jgi:DNA-binding NtrC family response regulator
MREVTSPDAERVNGKSSLRSNISQLERRMIAEALDRCRWNKARTARELGLSYPTLLSKIRSLEIERRKRA